MAPLLNPMISTVGCRGYRAVLALLYLCGLGFGIAAYISAEDALLPLIFSSLCAPASPCAILTVMCIPFLLSIVAVFISCPSLMVAVCFSKAFAFALTALGIYRCIGNTGYFTLMFLCFTDMISMPVLYFWWQRSFESREGFSLSASALFLSGALLIGSLYIHYICQV